MSEPLESSFEALFQNKATTIARDLKINLKRLLEESSLESMEGALALLATATSAEHLPLAAFAREKLASLGVSVEQIQEAGDSAAIMGMLNVYYRFKYMVSAGGQDGRAEEDYRTTGLRMTGLARPALGKLQFEMLAFAVSVLNGCQSCIRSHEGVLRDSGVAVDKIHDLARLAAVVKGLKALSLS